MIGLNHMLHNSSRLFQNIATRDDASSLSVTSTTWGANLATSSLPLPLPSSLPAISFPMADTSSFTGPHLQVDAESTSTNSERRRQALQNSYMYGSIAHSLPPGTFNDETFDITDLLALKCLLRPQLNAVCKRYGIKCTGTNEFLIQQLSAKAQALSREPASAP